MTRNAARSGAVAAFTLAAGVALAPGRAGAVDGYVYTTYTGAECLSGSNPARLEMTYSTSDGARSSSEVFCPIERMLPTAAHADVEVIFGPSASGRTVECSLQSMGPYYTGNSGSYSDFISSSGGILWIPVANQLTSGETSYWSPMGNDATATWRTLHLHCDSLGLPILGYSVTEYP